MEMHLASCKASSLTVREYCSQHEVKVHQYYYWQKKLQPQTQDSNFVKMSPTQTSSPVSVVFANGHQVDFTTLPPVDYLKQLMQ